MGLETGDFIDDLDLTNPITATDPVSEGAAHIRLLKKVLLQSFPGVDDVVNLTSAELNDLPQKAGDETITGFWNWSAELLMDNNVPIRGRNVANNASLDLINFNNADDVIFGASAIVNAFYDIADSHVFRHSLNKTVEMLPAAIGGLRAADIGGILSEVAKLGAVQTVAGAWTFDGTPLIGTGINLLMNDDSGFPQTALEFDGTTLRHGSSNRRSLVAGQTRVDFEVDGTIVGQAAPANSGGLLLLDEFGALRSAMFRSPPLRSIGVNTTLDSTFRGAVIQLSTGGITITIPQIQAEMAFLILNRSGGNCTIASSGSNVRAVLGGTELIAPFTIADNSIMQGYFVASDFCSCWGNGLS